MRYSEGITRAPISTDVAMQYIAARVLTAEASNLLCELEARQERLARLIEAAQARFGRRTADEIELEQLITGQSG
jgi:hypothetical protein